MLRLKSAKDIEYYSGEMSVGVDNYPPAGFKHCSKSFLERELPRDKYGAIWAVIDQMLQYSCGDYKNLIIDVKPHKLEKGQMPAMGNWHMDCVGRPDAFNREENNLLFLDGDCCNTEVLDEDVYVECDGLPKFPSWNQILGRVRSTKILNNRIARYGRVFHRACAATKSGHRLLIRVTETDITTPKNRKI